MHPTLKTLMILLLGGCNCLVAQINPNWTSPLLPVGKTDSTLDASGKVGNNMVVTSDSNIVYIFYSENSSGLYWTGSADDGLNWDSPSPSQVPVPGIGSMIGLSRASAAIDTSDNIHLIWQARGPDHGIFYSKRTKLTGLWSTPLKVNDTVWNHVLSFDQVTVDRKNRVHVFWDDGENNAVNDSISECWYARLLPSGMEFETPIPLSDTSDGKHSSLPVVNLKGNNSDTLFAAWRDNVSGENTGNWSVKYVYSLNGGTSWSTPEILHTPGLDTALKQWDPQVIVDKNNIVHIAFHEADTTLPSLASFNTRVYYGYTSDLGATWNNPVNGLNEFAIISDTFQVHDLCKSAYDHVNDIVWIFWKQENKPVGSEILGTYIKSGGTLWDGNLEYISDLDTIIARFHNFAIGLDGKVRAHYEFGSPSTIYYTERNPLPVSIEPSESSEPLSVKLYPNPFSDHLIIENGSGVETIEIYDMLGHSALSIDLKEGTNAVDLQQLIPGTYILRATAPNTPPNTFKLIKN